MAALKTQYGDAELHLVGPLQTNKVKEAVALFDVIQTLDREIGAQAGRAEGESGFPRLLIQVIPETSRKNPASHPLN